MLLDAYDGKEPRKHALGSDNLGRGPVIFQDRNQITPSFVSGALNFIRHSERNDKPFYVNLWPDDVHSPFFPPKNRRGDETKRALYLGVLKTMDEQLGELFDYVRASEKLKNNTLVLVCSDNGPEPGAGKAGPFRGSKGMLYEGGIRSPLIVWAPGLISADKDGAVNQNSVLAAIDLVPSLLSVSGLKAPEGVTYDGAALPDVLLGKSETSRPGPLFFRRPPDRGTFPNIGDMPDLAVREGQWKLLCEYDGSKPQLYNMATDRSETKNVAADNTEVVKRLTKSLLGWHQYMPPDNGPLLGKKAES